MTIKWHCLTCNKEGEKKISFQEILRIYDKNKVEKHVLEVIQDECKHECSGEPNVGIMLDNDPEKR